MKILRFQCGVHQARCAFDSYAPTGPPSSAALERKTSDPPLRRFSSSVASFIVESARVAAVGSEITQLMSLDTGASSRWGRGDVPSVLPFYTCRPRGTWQDGRKT